MNFKLVPPALPSGLISINLAVVDSENNKIAKLPARFSRLFQPSFALDHLWTLGISSSTFSHTWFFSSIKATPAFSWIRMIWSSGKWIEVLPPKTDTVSFSWSLTFPQFCFTAFFIEGGGGGGWGGGGLGWGCGGGGVGHGGVGGVGGGGRGGGGGGGGSDGAKFLVNSQGVRCWRIVIYGGSYGGVVITLRGFIWSNPEVFKGWVAEALRCCDWLGAWTIMAIRQYFSHSANEWILFPP